MTQDLHRREFLKLSAGLASAVGLGAGLAAPRAGAAEPAFQTVLKKAMIGPPTEENLKKHKDAGFDGLEVVVDRGEADLKAAEKARETAAKLGMKIHSVLRGWAEFNSPDKAAVERTQAVTETALKAAQAYGADAVLLVPCRIGGMRMPKPWEFLIDFDPATGHIRKVTAGDNAPFQDYIQAHNRSEDATREVVKRLIPAAEKAGVVIALENVWNNLWVKPAIFRNLVASFKSPWVKAYFDIGNHVKYAAPEEWILELGDLLSKLHIKDFKLRTFDPNGEGDWVHPRDGSVRWPVVRRALERVGYNGWMTVEDGGLPLEEFSKRLDQIAAGE